MISNNFSINSIKLVIWDLDETFWNGTLSEGKIKIPLSHIDLIKDLTNRGIINSICSKNNESEVIEVLRKYKIDNYFVFTSINWDSKGPRINKILQNIGLRSVNVLFIDDNLSNLKEAEFYNPGIKTSTPDIISTIINSIKLFPISDIEQKRLKQYRLLDRKYQESVTYSSNEEFLHSCNITVQINYNCLNELDRLYELSLRTNQLNFTKKRLSYDEFKLNVNNFKCGYITVQDKFGDYGIVGFFAISESKVLEHFYFSCRTIGLGIEQFIYSTLNYPELIVVNDVAVKLDSKSKPNWITLTARNPCDTKLETISSAKYLFKGPCDMSSMVGYLRLGNNVATEFTFIDNFGHSIENHNHSAHILGLKTFAKEQLKKLYSECFFLDDSNFKSAIYNINYNIIFLSTLIEGQYGLYRRKKSNEIVAFGHYDYPLTDESFWDKYINKTIPTYNYNITKEDLVKFSSKYEYIGRTTPLMYTQFLEFLLDNTSTNTTICLILGSETPFYAETESTYSDRAKYHYELNSAIKELAINKQRIKYVELSKFIKSQNDFTNNINHFKPNIYYAFAKEILNIINQLEESEEVPVLNKMAYFKKKYYLPIRQNIPTSIVNLLKKIKI